MPTPRELIERAKTRVSNVKTDPLTRPTEQGSRSQKIDMGSESPQQGDPWSVGEPEGQDDFWTTGGVQAPIRHNIDSDEGFASMMAGRPQEANLDQIIRDDEMVRGAEAVSQRGMSAPKKNIQIYEPPDLDITDEDVTRFLECLRTNKYYSLTFVKGSIKATFRVKSGNELDFQRATIANMMAKGEFQIVSDYYDAVSRFNLAFQLDTLNGVKLPRVIIPPRPWKEDSYNLNQQFWDSPLSKLSEPLMFILNGLMCQFENKVYEIEKRILDPSFTMPGDHT